MRDRIERVLAPKIPFGELSPLAAFGAYREEALAAGLVPGIGLAHGREVMVIANDATFKGET